MNETTPDTPLDLLSIQRKPNVEGHDSFFETVGELFASHEPCLCEIQSVVERLADYSLSCHRDALKEDGDEMPDWARARWQADKKKWKKVLRLVRDIH